MKFGNTRRSRCQSRLAIAGYLSEVGHTLGAGHPPGNRTDYVINEFTRADMTLGCAVERATWPASGAGLNSTSLLNRYAFAVMRDTLATGEYKQYWYRRPGSLDAVSITKVPGLPPVSMPAP